MEQYSLPDDGVRVPPNHPESERSVLGSMLRSREAALLAIETLKPDDFYDPANREVYSAMFDMASASRTIDLVTLDEELSRRGKLDAVGGAAYLVELSRSVPSAANVQAYIKIVDEKSTLRKLIAASEQILQQSYAAQEETQEILETAEKAIASANSRKNKFRLSTIKAQIFIMALFSVAFRCSPLIPFPPRQPHRSRRPGSPSGTGSPFH